MLHHHKLQSKCHNVSFKQEVVCNKHMAVLATGCCSEHADARGAHIAMPANHLCAVFICCYACMQPRVYWSEYKCDYCNWQDRISFVMPCWHHTLITVVHSPCTVFGTSDTQKQHVYNLSILLLMSTG